jgi:hypothetical protein
MIDESLKPEHIEDQIKDTAHSFGSTWKITFTPQQIPSELEKLLQERGDSIILIESDIGIADKTGEHLVYLKPNPEETLSDIDIFNLAKISLAEVDLIFGTNLLIYDKQNLRSEIHEFQQSLELCEKTSTVWAMDKMHAVFPARLESYLISLIEQNLQHTKDNFSIEEDVEMPIQTLQAFLDMAMYLALYKDRYKFKPNYDLQKEVEDYIYDLGWPTMVAKKTMIIYAYLSKMPKDRDVAVDKLIDVTRKHFDFALPYNDPDNVLAMQVKPSDKSKGYYHIWRLLDNYLITQYN